MRYWKMIIEYVLGVKPRIRSETTDNTTFSYIIAMQNVFLLVPVSQKQVLQTKVTMKLKLLRSVHSVCRAFGVPALAKIHAKVILELANRIQFEQLVNKVWSSTKEPLSPICKHKQLFLSLLKNVYQYDNSLHKNKWRIIKSSAEKVGSLDVMEWRQDGNKRISITNWLCKS